MITNKKVTLPNNYLIKDNMFIKNEWIENIITNTSEFKKIATSQYKDKIINILNQLNDDEKIKCQHLLIYMNKFINVIIRQKIDWLLTVEDLIKIFSLINNYLQLNDFEFNLFIRNTIDINLFTKNHILNFFKTGCCLGYSNSFIEIMQSMLGNNYKNSEIWNNVPQNNRIIDLCTNQEIAYTPYFVEINIFILNILNNLKPSNIRNIDLKQYYDNQTFYNKLLSSLFQNLKTSKNDIFDFYIGNNKKLKIVKTKDIDNRIEIINQNNKIVILSFYDPIEMENYLLNDSSSYFILNQPQSNNNKEYYNVIRWTYNNIDDFLNKINHKNPINRAPISTNDIFNIKSFFEKLCK